MHQPIKVLIADDEENHLELIQRALSRENNIEITLANSLKELTSIIDSVYPDIVLTDFKFPDGNAREFIDAYCKILPIVVMTSFGDEKLAVEMIKAGAIDYLVKSPETFVNIRWTIERNLREWDLTKEYHLNLKELKEREEHNKLMAELLNITPASITVHDFKGNFLYFNKKAYEMHGYTFEEYRSSRLSDFLVEGELELMEERMNAIRNQGVATFESVHRKKDGSSFSVLVFAELINWGGRDVILSTASDISLIKKAEQEIFLKNKEIEAQNEILQMAKEKAEESDKLKSAFLANMSHEIRTPMNGIIGFSDLLESKSLNDDQRQQYIQIIKNSGLQLLSIINDIIDISKIETGQVTLSKDKVLLYNILQELLTFFLPIARKKDLRLLLTYNPADFTEKIYVDVVKLKQILTNLISNAIKFTDTGYIEFGVESKNNILEFFVKDTGIGIPSDFKDVIFERFRQADYNISGKHGGTGLGLAISKAYVNLMGGEIWLVSEKGAGSTFYFQLPYNPVQPDMNKDNETQNFMNGKQDFSGRTILIAEDELINFLYLKEIILSTKANIEHAENGFDALDLMNSGKKIDLVFMDLKMPIMNGFEAIQKIRQVNKDVPIIAVTAFAFADERAKAFEAGCNDFIYKPYRSSDILQRLLTYLNNN